jgi:hypothetical protein
MKILPPIPKPQITQDVSLHDMLFGPAIDPIERVTTYDGDRFEKFVLEWAYEYLQNTCKEYVQVSRFGGAGDKGRDIVCYISTNPVKCDVFQCKHYRDPIGPSEARIELAKLCLNTFQKSIPVPSKYRFVSPRDVSSKLGLSFDDPAAIKSDLIENWKKTTGKAPLCSRLIKGQKTYLEGKLLEHVERFDFSIVHFKPMHEVIAEFRKTSLYAARFGGGLTKKLPPDKKPPPDPDAYEQVYVTELIAAYSQNLSLTSLDLRTLGSHGKHFSHFVRSRERFYCAETVREFAKDSLPPNFSFDDVQKQVYDGVVDTEQQDWPCGYTRAVEVTKIAQSISITNTPLASCLQPKSLQGICHQLVNDKRLRWVHHD